MESALNLQKKIVLEDIGKAFKKGKQYTEKEVNLIIADFHDDFCTIRRDMVAEGILERKDGVYILNREKN